MAKTQLWEIYVPTIRNDGRPYSLRYHRVWDKSVRDLAGGLSIIQPIMGQWLDQSGTMYEERMIPVRVACGYITMQLIVKMTLEYYSDQKAIMFYKISDECHIISRGEPVHW